MATTYDLLFSQRSLSEQLRARDGFWREEIRKIDADHLLSTSIEDWCDYLEDKYRLTVPHFQVDGITIEQRDIQTEPRQRQIYLNKPGPAPRPVPVSGTEITFYIPFEGDAWLFRYQPSSYDLNPPRADIRENELVLTYTVGHHNPKPVASDKDRDLESIQWYLEQVEKEVTPSMLHSEQRCDSKSRPEGRSC